jgi:hypothetical protein
VFHLSFLGCTKQIEKALRALQPGPTQAVRLAVATLLSDGAKYKPESFAEKPPVNAGLTGYIVPFGSFNARFTLLKSRNKSQALLPNCRDLSKLHLSIRARMPARRMRYRI